MSKRPTGTTMDDDRLHEFRETDETTASTLAIDVSALADRMRASPGDPTDWTVDDDRREEFPMLVVNAIDEAETDDVDETALDIAREVHERQAEQLIETADDPEYRDAVSEYDVAVTDVRDTSEWEFSEPGTSR
ncbi:MULTISPECIES: hypothetical protein [Natrialbaceae]|uniref:hypothetical protein n=1 Tax=Natrialbaceae TaxID=1644061 RepID=UPI00207D6645|nr:hypothetical protein [Natronococcus sp. CG52]